MGFFKKFFSQTRKPEGALGNIMLWGMNSGHAKMADWGISHLKVDNPKYIADIGCGGGRNAAELLKRYSKAKVTAVDYSPLSVKKATEYNKKAIADGRCKITQGDVSNLSLPKEKFDLVTAFETVYFWPDIEKCFTEVFGIIKNSGVFMITNELDGNDAASLKYEQIIDGMKIYTADELKCVLSKVGFSYVETFHHQSMPWIAVVAKK